MVDGNYLREKRTALLQAWARLPGNVRGAIWVLAASVAFTGMTISIRQVGTTMSVWQMLVLRSLFAFFYILPLIYRNGLHVISTQHPKLHLLRGTIGFCGVLSLFVAVTHLNLALVTTLGFTRILFVIILAAFFLGEVIRWRRTTATLIGFAGVLICLRPGSEAFDPYTLVGLAAALFAALVSTTVKHMTRTEHPLAIITWTYFVIGGLALIPAILVWRMPTVEELLLLALMGALTAAGQTCMVLGLRAGDATAVTPFEYGRLPLAILAGYLFFAEFPSLWTYVGAAVIIGATLYIAIREAQLGRPKPEAKQAIEP